MRGFDHIIVWAMKFAVAALLVAAATVFIKKAYKYRLLLLFAL
jgi:hypothetical protein